MISVRKIYSLARHTLLDKYHILLFTLNQKQNLIGLYVCIVSVAIICSFDFPLYLCFIFITENWLELEIYHNLSSFSRKNVNFFYKNGIFFYQFLYRNTDDRWPCWSIFAIRKTERPHLAVMKIGTGMNRSYGMSIAYQKEKKKIIFCG